MAGIVSANGREDITGVIGVVAYIILAADLITAVDGYDGIVHDVSVKDDLGRKDHASLIHVVVDLREGIVIDSPQIGAPQ